MLGWNVIGGGSGVLGGNVVWESSCFDETEVEKKW